mgnify:FL=1
MSYNANDIETLDFRTAIRTKIAMYLGSADNQGVLQAIREIITNSIDEYTMGYGNEIYVDLYKGNRITIADRARGVPFGTREDGTDAMEAIFMLPHSGGKFNEKVYQNVAGLNGIGAKGTALSSSYFKAQSFRDGQCATLELKDGIKTSLTVRATTSKDPKSGTCVEFIPSQEVYKIEPININFEEVKKMCRDWSYLCKGLTFVLVNHITNEKVKYLSKDGLVDLLKDEGGKLIHRTPLHIEIKEEDTEVEIVMAWTGSRKEEAHAFANGLENIDGGTHITGIKTALTNFFKKRLKDADNSDVYRRGLYYAVSCKLPNPQYSNQTKTKCVSPSLRGICQRATTKMLERFEIEHKDEFGKIVELLGKELKAEVAAERARKQVLEASKDIEKNQKRKVFASDKLKDAEFLGQDATLLICEGDSALGSLTQARNSAHFGLLAVRGKILNCLSNDEEKIYQNEEIKLLLSAMNITPGKYDSKKLRYGRIGIAVDADSDGYHIGLLIMACLTKLAPQFITEKRLCWLRTPLFIVEKGKTRSYYFNDAEFEEAKVKGLVSGVVHRAKGIGALEAEEAHESMFTEKYQRLETLAPDEDSFSLIQNLMGSNVEPRTNFMFNKIDFSQIHE